MANATVTRLPVPTQTVRRTTGRTEYRVRHNGRVFRAVHEPRCSVCKLDNIQDLHRLAIQAAPVSRIMRAIPEEANVSQKALRSHLRRHFPDYLAYDFALESISLSEGGNGFPDRCDPAMVAQYVVEQGFKELADGHMQIKASDLINAARFLSEVEERREGANDQAVYTEAFALVLGAVQSTLTPDAFRDMVWKLNSDPRMIEVMRRVSGAPQREIIDVDMDDCDDDDDDDRDDDEVPVAIEAASEPSPEDVPAVEPEPDLADIMRSL